MLRILVLLATLAAGGCANFPCSPSNPCAPGDGGASMRDTARVINDINRPVYVAPAPTYVTPMPRYTRCYRNGGVVECVSQ